jgi:hypothetical protein
MAERPEQGSGDEVVVVPLHAIAHARAGDKGDRLNVSLFVYDPKLFDIVVDQVTEERVLRHFHHRGATRATRYLLPLIGGLNFVIEPVLQGGVNGALNLDGHGKSLSFYLLTLPVEVPRALL